MLPMTVTGAVTDVLHQHGGNVDWKEVVKFKIQMRIYMQGIVDGLYTNFSRVTFSS